MGIYLEKQILFILLVPIWILLRVISFLIKNRNKTKFSFKREVLLNVFFIYVLCLISVTFFPLRIGFNNDFNGVSVNLVPVINTVKEVTATINDPNLNSFMINIWIKNIVGNMILLLPIGVLAPILWVRFNGLLKTSLLAFFISLCIETLQLASGYIGNIGRAFDIDDILLNILGASLGFIFYNVLTKNKKSSLSNFHKNNNGKIIN